MQFSSTLLFSVYFLQITQTMNSEKFWNLLRCWLVISRQLAQRPADNAILACLLIYQHLSSLLNTTAVDHNGYRVLTQVCIQNVLMAIFWIFLVKTVVEAIQWSQPFKVFKLLFGWREGSFGLREILCWKSPTESPFRDWTRLGADLKQSAGKTGIIRTENSSSSSGDIYWMVQ